MNQPTITIQFRGHPPSKKNLYSPRKDRPGMFKNAALRTALDRLAIQIPSDARDLKLENPDIGVYFYYTKANWDRTNAWQTIEDLLVEYGVLSDDNIRRNNGTITIHPAIKFDYDGCTVILHPKG
jgi:hypothetical protein